MNNDRLLAIVAVCFLSFCSAMLLMAIELGGHQIQELIKANVRAECLK